MDNKITFYYNPMSRGRIVHWMLEEVGADYEIKLLDWTKADNKSPEYLKINPMGKIPAIVHKGVVVTETAAICAYLADAFPGAKLAPSLSDPKRGSFYRWMFFTVNCLEPAVADRLLPRQNPMPSSHNGYGTYELTMKVLEEAVHQGYVLGDQFSAADVYLSSVLGWYFFQKMIEPTPTLSAYVERCHGRPAHMRFQEKLSKMM